jgi:hypothetical protein
LGTKAKEKKENGGKERRPRESVRDAIVKGASLFLFLFSFLFLFCVFFF